MIGLVVARGSASDDRSSILFTGTSFSSCFHSSFCPVAQSIPMRRHLDDQGQRLWRMPCRSASPTRRRIRRSATAQLGNKGQDPEASFSRLDLRLYSLTQLDSTVPVSQVCTLRSGFLTLEALESLKLNLEGFRKGFVGPGSGWCHCPNLLQAFKSSIHTAKKTNRPTA